MSTELSVLIFIGLVVHVIVMILITTSDDYIRERAHLKRTMRNYDEEVLTAILGRSFKTDTMLSNNEVECAIKYRDLYRNYMQRRIISQYIVALFWEIYAPAMLIRELILKPMFKKHKKCRR